MKKNDIILAFAIITLTVMACTQKKQQVAPIKTNQQESEVEMDKEHNKSIQSKDSTAIGNICLNVTKEEFENQKKIFMKETPELGGLKIKSVNGLFYDNRLAAIQIISQQQDFHKKGGIANGWYMMYYEKYGKQHKSNKYRFDFEKGLKAIAITDLSATDKPFSSFEQFMENPFNTCYKKEQLYSEDDIDSIFYFSPLMDRKLFRLPKQRQEYYKKMINEIERKEYLSDASYIVSKRKICEELRVEINDIIERNNEINTEKHKNDPSWSVIVVAYLPLCDKYSNYIRKKENERERKMKSDRQKELNKI